MNNDLLIDTYQLLADRYDYWTDHGTDIGEAEHFDGLRARAIADQAVLFAMGEGL